MLLSVSTEKPAVVVRSAADPPRRSQTQNTAAMAAAAFGLVVGSYRR